MAERFGMSPKSAERTIPVLAGESQPGYADNSAGEELEPSVNAHPSHKERQPTAATEQQKSVCYEVALIGGRPESLLVVPDSAHYFAKQLPKLVVQARPLTRAHAPKLANQVTSQ